MQTFLPYSSFTDSAACLDRQRLGKQRVETLQIMNVLMLHQTAWRNHPAVKMWRGYERALLEYQWLTVVEWMQRGYKDTCYVKTMNVFYDNCLDVKLEFPPWLGDETFHISHQSNLIRKLPEHYGPLFPGVPDDLEYIWPGGK